MSPRSRHGPKLLPPPHLSPQVSTSDPPRISRKPTVGPRAPALPPDATPCHPMPPHAAQCHPIPPDATPCCPMPPHAALCRPMLPYAAPCHPMPPHATPCRPMPPKAAQGAAAQTLLPVSQPSLAFYLCNLGDTGELAKPCQGDPLMQRLHFGPNTETEMSRRWGASKAKGRRCGPPLASPGLRAAMLRWLLGNSALLDLLGLVSKQRLDLSSHLCSSSNIHSLEGNDTRAPTCWVWSADRGTATEVTGIIPCHGEVCAQFHRV